MATITTEPALLRLLQLSSATLPVGAYACSQGLEYAVEVSWVNSPATLHEWLVVQLDESLVRVDVPLLFRQYEAATSGDVAALTYWNDYALACRETGELRETDVAMGVALSKLMAQLHGDVQHVDGDTSFITSFAIAAAYWRIPAGDAAAGYLWSWLENQVAAAVKLVPLGQVAAQRSLGELQAFIPDVIARAAAIADEAVGATLPALAMASARHEQQYTRLFRS